MKLINSMVLTAVLFTITACGNQFKEISELQNSTEAAGIMGGEVKEDFKKNTNFVNVVSILGNAYFSCSAVVLSKRAILTAAYCVDNASYIRVMRAERSDFKTKAALLLQLKNAIAPTSVAFTPGFLKKPASQARQILNQDLAVLHFANDLPENFVPALLPSSALNLKVGDRLTIAGTGMDRKTFATATVKIVNPAYTSSEQNGGFLRLTQSLLSGTCFGDGGGPAFAIDTMGRSVLVGLAGFQISEIHATAMQSTESCRDGAAYFRVDTTENLSWIKAQASK